MAFVRALWGIFLLRITSYNVCYTKLLRNLEIPQGAVFGLLGPNGAGKTTTLRVLLGLQRATAGKAEVFGKPSYNFV